MPNGDVLPLAANGDVVVHQSSETFGGQSASQLYFSEQRVISACNVFATRANQYFSCKSCQPGCHHCVAQARIGKRSGFAGLSHSWAEYRFQMDEPVRKNQNAMQRDVARFVRLVEICPNGIAVLKDDKIQLANPALQELVKRSADDLADRPIVDILAEDVHDSTVRRLREMRAAGLHHQTSCATRLVRSDGGKIEADASIDELELSGEADEVIVFRPHAAFRNANLMTSEELLKLSHLLRMATFGELTASLLHELGQPLTAAHGASEVLVPSLGTQRVSEHTTRAAEIISESVGFAAKHFQRIWEFVRQKEPKRHPVSVSEVVSQAVKLTETAIRHAGVRLEIETRDTGTISADAPLLESVFASLLVRSMTSLSGHPETDSLISVEVSRPAPSRVEVNVEHNGDALSSERQFLQGTPEETTNYAAGLTIEVIRSIVELNGGILAIEEARKGSGVCYRIIFPLNSSR